MSDRDTPREPAVSRMERDGELLGDHDRPGTDGLVSRLVDTGATYIIDHRRKHLAEELPDEYLALEARCFQPLYRMAPITRSAFHAMFKADCDVFSCRATDELVGLAFVEDVDWQTSYLRVLCVHPDFRRRRIAVSLLERVRVHLISRARTLLAFVAAEGYVNDAALKAAFREVSDPVDQERLAALVRYNDRLGRMSRERLLPDYYTRPDGSQVCGQLYLLLVE